MILTIIAFFHMLFCCICEWVSLWYAWWRTIAVNEELVIDTLNSWSIYYLFLFIKLCISLSMNALHSKRRWNRICKFTMNWITCFCYKPPQLTIKFAIIVVEFIIFWLFSILSIGFTICNSSSGKCAKSGIRIPEASVTLI